MVTYPEYERSPVAIASSILRYFGVEWPYPSLALLDRAFERKPKHVALVVFDGLGSAQLEKYLDEKSFLRAHCLGPISSVFPPTTVASMNSYYSGLPPAQHGWLGWSLYFKESGRAVDIFPRVDSVTKQKISGSFNPWQILSYKTVPDMIEDAATPGDESLVSYIAPSGIGIPGNRSESISIAGIDHFFEALRRQLVEGDGSGRRSFTMAYWPDPDITLHKTGGEAESIYEIMRDLDARCEALVRACREDTLVIVSADHGHIDVNRYVDISDIPGLIDCMIMPPFLEVRSALFFIKHDKRQAFEEIYRSHLSNEFALFSRKEILERGLFGPVSDKMPVHRKTDDFIADYLVTATGKRAIKYYEPEHDHTHDFASHHAGMTESEMKIPLIVWPPQL